MPAGRPPERAIRPAYTTPEEYRALVNAAQGNNLLTLCLELIFRCGLRLSEILEIQHQDVAVAEGKIRVENRGRPRLGQARTIKLPKPVQQTLRNYLREYPGDPANKLVTVTQFKVWAGLRDLATPAGIDEAKCRPDTIRNGYGVRAIRAGLTPEQIMRRMGHYHPSVPKRYQLIVDVEAYRKQEQSF